MSKPPLTAGETSLADQLLAEADAELGTLATGVALETAERGEAQAAADFMAWLAREHSPSYLAALVVAAVRKREPS